MILKRIRPNSAYTYRVNSEGFQFKRIYFGMRPNSYLKIKTKDTFDQWQNQIDSQTFPIHEKIRLSF